MEDKNKVTNSDEKDILTDEELNVVENYIKDDMDWEDIPDSLKPENIRKRLEEAEVQKVKANKTKKIKRWAAILATAACMGILVTAGLHMKDFGREETIGAENTVTTESAMEEDAVEGSMEESAEAANNEEIYEKIYDAMNKNWAEAAPEDKYYGGLVKEESAIESTTGSTSGSTLGSPLAGGGDLGSTNADMSSTSRDDYGETNVQVEFVDEGDIVKNDGRYLYQIVRDTNGNYGYEDIQIVDTKDGLKEISRIEGFDNVQEFYIYEDTAVIIERLWATSGTEKIEKTYSATENSEMAVEEEIEDIAMTDMAVCGTVYEDTAFSKIYMYDISDRSKPKEIHTFTLKGNYKTSRISDGYLYFFTGYSTTRPESRDDLEKYIPVIDGKLLDGDSLYLPEYTDATSYMVMVSVDMSNPTAFTDKMAAVTWGSYYYVSGENIYVLDNQRAGQKEGVQCDKTRIMKFSYEKGNIEPVCEDVVDGTMLDQFAMDEYNGYFRLITTVSPYKLEKVTDDVTGEELGYYNWEYMPETNSVYVLDKNLKVAGSIENLAEDERVYSARFMGDTGYFVTFRQTDPLFSVDFSNPKEPKILGELKISGFSEYLHFYGENMLLGIGYEADEETGRTEGIKLSMFDVSDPSNVKEINKVVTEYEYCDAVYNHHAVLISVSKNLIGFMAEDYQNDIIREYTAYSYNDEKGFKQRFTVDYSPTKENDWTYYEGRGTYINDMLYVLTQDGSIKAYDLNSGKKVEELKIEKKK